MTGKRKGGVSNFGGKKAAPFVKGGGPWRIMPSRVRR